MFPGEFRDPLATVADGLFVRGPRLRVSTPGPVEPLDLGRHEPAFLDSLATVGEAEPAEPAVQRVWMPGPAVRVREQRLAGVTRHHLPGDLEPRSVRQTTRLAFLPLASSAGKIHRPLSSVNVSRLDGEDLLRPTAGLPEDDKQVPERR